MRAARADLDCRVLIVGTGFAGLGMAIRLVQEGGRDILVLEQADEAGRTWRDNTYPGAACDVPSHLYAFSFAPNPHWTRHDAPQEEILACLRGLVDGHDLHAHLPLGRQVVGARFDADNGCWWVATACGETLRARVLIPACGGLGRSKPPVIPGRDPFAGSAFHTARWRHDVDLAAKRVGKIGTGASASQVVPGIADRVRRLAVFQRTPPWVVPRRDRPIPRRERTLCARVLSPGGCTGRGSTGARSGTPWGSPGSRASCAWPSATCATAWPTPRSGSA